MKMITLNRKKIIVSLLLICLVWFGYVNLALKNRSHIPVTTTNQNSQANNVVVEEKSKRSGETNNNQAMIPEAESITGQEKDDYFVNYRIDREKMRSEQMEILQGIVDNPNSASDMRKDAQGKMLQITQNLENELKLENLIRAKSFPDAVLLIHP